MQEPEVTVEVSEREPTPEELEMMAAKQLLLELQIIKNKIYASGTLMNGMLIMQVKFLLNGLNSKYHNAGLLVGEEVGLKMRGRGKYASMFFTYTPRLQQLLDKVVEELDRSKENIDGLPN